jgi:FK506-binding protein 4/5
LWPCLQLVSWLPGGGVKCVGPSADVFLRSLRAGQGWESPRPPFEVSAHINARTASPSGSQGCGEQYFSSRHGEPVACALGAGQLPPGEPAERCGSSWLMAAGMQCATC